MLERYFLRPSTCDRLRALWLGPAIDRYVEWLTDRHAASATVKRSVHALVIFNDFTQTHGAKAWADLPPLVDPFLDHWMRTRGARCKTARDSGTVLSNGRAPVEQLLSLLLPDFGGSKQAKPLPFAHSVPGFFLYLREERGLRASTTRRHSYYLGLFEAYLKTRHNGDLSVLSPTLVSDYLIECGQHLSSIGVSHAGSTLRIFLRYLHRQGVITVDLSRAVPRGRRYKHASIPRSISWDDVQRVLALIDRRDAVGKRDFAMLTLLVNYGLRAREVATLQLDDLDWSKAQLHVPSRKGGHSTIYPLSTAVGDAIIDYLRHGRPDVGSRQLFLNLRSPFDPIAHTCVSHRATFYLRKANIQVPRPGSHTFRHACVQRMVNADVSFKVIGDYVGHRSPESTQVYGKVALHKLRQLSLGDAEEIL